MTVQLKNYITIVAAALLVSCFMFQVSSCSRSQQTGQKKKELTKEDSLYTWENIRQSLIEQPEKTLGMIDSAEMRGVADVNYANWMRAQTYYGSPKIQDLEKARDYCLQILENKNPVVDSLRRLLTLDLLVSICISGTDTQQEAVRYAMKGAEMAHQAGNRLSEARFYFDAGNVMEKLQEGSGIDYMKRSLDIYREASRNEIRLLPVFSSNLGNTARVLTKEGKYADVVSLLQERLEVIMRIEKEYTTAPAGWTDEQRAYTYPILAYCQHMTGDKEGARQSAEAFERTKASQNPERQDDIMLYYALVGNAGRIQQIYDRLEPYYREKEDTLSSSYARLLYYYAMGLDASGRSHEAYQTLCRYHVIDDSLMQRERQNETLKYAQQMKTQEKELQIVDQQMELSQQRWLGTLMALVLLTAFFIVYTWYRRKAQNRLAEAHTQLKTAYDQLEETTAAKERIESELRIARDIQMSMVPGVFPEYDGLDMFASMVPAKEVGGDLYGYVLKGDQLYFCVGDVSGKGVPASLFMAQGARLFRILASQGLKPAEICTFMNDALTEDNKARMFVTFFLGLLDLKTGLLDFCNCGHNAPVIGDDNGHADLLKMIPNLPIGIMPRFKFRGEQIESMKGKRLFVYTDGLNEAENQENEQFGNDQMLDILRRDSLESARHVIETMTAEVEQHRHGAEPNDDLTMMAICLKN